MKIRKILAAFVSVVTICSVISVPTFAAQETQIVTDLVSPAYEYAMSTKSYLTITSSTAECKSVCDGMAGVTQITVEHTLEKHCGYGMKLTAQVGQRPLIPEPYLWSTPNPDLTVVHTG